MTFREVDKILRKNGWKCIRINGSHHQYQKNNAGPTVTVPNHKGRDISIGVLKNLERGTGLSFR